LAITIPLAVILNIRLDEGYTLQTTGAGPQYAWHQAIHFELQPPLFFVLLSLWRKLDHGILFARLFSVLCVALTVALVFALARRYLPELSATAVALIIAVNPFTIWSALDIRVYAFAMLLSAVLLLLFYDGFLADDGAKRERWLYLIVAALALYTQYYLGFLLLAGAVALVVQRRWRPLRFYLLGMLGVGVIFIPMLPEVFKQFFVHSKDVTPYDDWWTTLNDFLWIVKGHILPAESTKFELIRWWILLIGAPLLVVLVALNRKRIHWRKFGPVWTIVLVMLPFFLLLRYRSGYGFFSPKHTVSLFLPLIISFLGLVWVAGRQKAVWVWTVVALVASVVSLFAVYRPLAKLGDWRRTSDYVMVHEQSDQPILFFTPTGVLPFSYYYHGPNRLVPIPRAETFDTYDIERYVIHQDDDMKASIPVVLPGQKLWLVTDHFCRLQSVEFNCPLLEDFVSRYYVVESDQELYGSRIRLLTPRPPGVSAQPNAK
jgi:uncharacterized membrane protein